jgi:hypothetical protein
MSSGGAIANGAGTLVVETSAFYSNQASTAGGAIVNQGGTATVTNSTFYGNSAIGLWGGGAIYNHFYPRSASGASESLPFPENAASPNDAMLVITASTFYSNTAPGGGGAIGNGSESELGGVVILQNTAFGFNQVATSTVNCYNNGGTLTDGGYNLEDADSCGFSSTSITDTNPLFLGFGSYGGSTPTVALHSDSPAVDYIPVGVNGCGTTLITDQRGFTRPQGLGCEVGAFELALKLYLPLITKAP